MLRTTFLALCLILSSSASHALTVAFGGPGDSSLHGASGSLAINEVGGGDFDVVWSMDFTDFDVAGAEATGHEFLTDIGFKAFSRVSAVTLDEIVWNAPTTSTLFESGRISNAGCTGPSRAAFVCLADLSPVDATNGGVFEAHFTVSGRLDMEEWSYRGNFGPRNGWVISESASPIPEPSAALVFAVGLGVVSSARRHRR